MNAVAPGPIETPIFGRTGLPKEALDEFSKQILESNPMKRFGSQKRLLGGGIPGFFDLRT